MFDKKTIMALQHLIKDRDWFVRRDITKFFTAAAAQGMFFF